LALTRIKKAALHAKEKESKVLLKGGEDNIIRCRTCLRNVDQALRNLKKIGSSQRRSLNTEMRRGEEQDGKENK